jgi:hypothetical protein
VVAGAIRIRAGIGGGIVLASGSVPAGAVPLVVRAQDRADLTPTAFLARLGWPGHAAPPVSCCRQP